MPVGPDLGLARSRVQRRGRNRHTARAPLARATCVHQRARGAGRCGAGGPRGLRGVGRGGCAAGASGPWPNGSACPAVRSASSSLTSRSRATAICWPGRRYEDELVRRVGPRQAASSRGPHDARKGSLPSRNTNTGQNHEHGPIVTFLNVPRYEPCQIQQFRRNGRTVPAFRHVSEGNFSHAAGLPREIRCSVRVLPRSARRDADAATRLVRGCE